MKESYEDIMNFPYCGVKDHPRMSMNERAGQFSPFEALFDNEDLENLADSFLKSEKEAPLADPV